MRSTWEVVLRTDKALVIRDLDAGMSVTNDAEAVVEYLSRVGRIKEGMRLHYYDTDGRLDELLFSKDGKFSGFSFAAPDADVSEALSRGGAR